MQMMPTRDATPAKTTIDVRRPTTRLGGRGLRTLRIKMAPDARRVDLCCPAHAFRAAGAVLVCAGTLLGLGLIGASRVDAHEERAAQGERSPKASTPVASRPDASGSAIGAPLSNPIRPQSDRRASAIQEAFARPMPATRPTSESNIAESTIPDAVIDGQVVELAAYRMPAQKAIPPVAGQELMRSIPAGEKPQATAVRPPAAAPRAKLAKTRIVRMEVTAYCPCTKCCGPNAQGVTASGLPVSHNGGRFVAADTSVLPFRTKLVIPGYHADVPVEVIDRGGAIKGKRLDVYYPTHAEALEWGRQWVNVTVVAE